MEASGDRCPAPVRGLASLKIKVKHYNTIQKARSLVLKVIVVVVFHSDLQGSNFESCVWGAVSSHSSHNPQEVILVQLACMCTEAAWNPINFISLSSSTDGHARVEPTGERQHRQWLAWLGERGKLRRPSHNNDLPGHDHPGDLFWNHRQHHGDRSCPSEQGQW